MGGKLIERVSVVFYFREATKQHSEEVAGSTKVTSPNFDILMMPHPAFRRHSK